MEKSRKKLNKPLITLLVLSFAILFGALAVQAAQENEIYEPHECEYEVVAFVDGTAYCSCTICGDIETVEFMDYVNSYYAPLDVVEDGIINAKDYAYLIKNYPSVVPTTPTETTSQKYTTPYIPIG